MKNLKEYYKWPLIAFIIYTLSYIIGFSLFLILDNTTSLLDTDMLEISAYILTTSSGFFSWIMGYNSDIFDAGNFHLSTFLLGGLFWITISLLLYSISKRKPNKAIFAGKILFFLGLIIGIIISIIAYIRAMHDGFAIVLTFLSAAIYFPMIIVGIGMIIYGFISVRKQMNN